MPTTFPDTLRREEQHADRTKVARSEGECPRLIQDYVLLTGDHGTPIRAPYSP